MRLLPAADHATLELHGEAYELESVDLVFREDGSLKHAILHGSPRVSDKDQPRTGRPE